MNYCSSGLDISAYWSTLKRSNITRERLASFDRCILSSKLSMIFQSCKIGKAMARISYVIQEQR
jgi:hypothetical protein